MTVAVAFLCSDGVVVAADSMLTPSVGNLPVGHHKGKKVSVLSGGQLFAFAGDQGQAERFKIMANGSYAAIANAQHALDYPIGLTTSLIQQFHATGIGNVINVNTVLAYVHSDKQQCCIFEGAIQPRLLDTDHYYAALGSGKLAADPFLRFLVDVFCGSNSPPNTREAIFLATWTIQHVIDTNPGGVAGPIRVATLERNAQGVFEPRELPVGEIEEHQQAIESAAQALRTWRDAIQSGKAADGLPSPPILSPPARTSIHSSAQHANNLDASPHLITSEAVI